MTDVKLEVGGMKKNYGENTGISDVSLSVEKGTLHGFLGLNGAGKTTTMKCIVGLLRKDGGFMKIDGVYYDPDNLSLRSTIGYSPELPSYPPYLNGKEVIQVYSRMHLMSKIEGTGEAERLLGEVGLIDAADRRVGKYSRGMKAKLGVAVAMIGNPDLLILDEPTSGLDPAAAANMRKILTDRAKSGSTILLSSHLLNEVQNMCRNISIINRGKTIAEGSVEEIAGTRGNVSAYETEFNSYSPELIDEIKKLEEVVECNFQDAEKKKIIVSVKGGTDIRERLGRLAISHDAVMLSCNKRKESLEDLFLSMVEDGCNNDQ